MASTKAQMESQRDHEVRLSDEAAAREAAENAKRDQQRMGCS